MALKISDEAKVQMPMKTVASLIALVAIGTWAYFGVIETLNKHTTTLELMQKDLEQNSEFRIKEEAKMTKEFNKVDKEIKVEKLKPVEWESPK